MRKIMYDTIHNDEILNVTDICDIIDCENPYLLVGDGSVWNGHGKIFIAEKYLDEAAAKLLKNCIDVVIYKENGNVYIDAYHYDGMYHVKAIKLPAHVFDEYECWRDGYTSIFAAEESEENFWQIMLKILKLDIDI